MREFLDSLKVYESLEFVVEVRDNPNLGGWEATAAFNVGTVAAGYAARCREANDHNLYRVRRRCSDGRWLTYEGTS